MHELEVPSLAWQMYMVNTDSTFFMLRSVCVHNNNMHIYNVMSCKVLSIY